MPIAIGGEVFEDEISYTAKLLGIELPKQDTSPTPKEGRTEALHTSGTQVPPAGNSASVGNVEGVRGLLKQGNIDIHNRPVVKNPDGSISTVRSMSIGTDEGEVLIPTVAADGSGILSDDDAIAQYRKTGQHLGIFDNPDDANAYAQSLHNQQAEEYVKPRYQTWPERMVRGAISAFALPGDVYSGKVKPGSPQEIERAMDLAGLMVFGPAPVASRLAEGTLGSFAGVTSKTIDKNRLAQAQLLDQKGVHPDVIWEKTGFFRGADDRWRYEIPDDKSTLNTKGFDHRVDEDMSGESVPFVSVKKEGTTLGEALNHPELFKAYPHLKDVQILPLPKSIADRGTIGQMVGDTMYLKDDLHPDFVRSVILHELQHSIQNKEKFARGGNFREFTHPNLDKAQKIYDDAIAAGGDPKSEALQKARAILEEETERAHTMYKRLMGEVESRNVQTRMDFDELTRQRNTPRSTEDTPRFLQEKR